MPRSFPRFLLTALAMLAFAPGLARATVQLTDTSTMTWGAVPGAVGYHIYRGLLPGGLPFDYGTCYVGSVQGTSIAVAGDPVLGEVHTFLFSSFDENGETDLGTDSGGTPRFPSVPCKPALRNFALTPNGDPGDGVIDGREPRRNLSAYAWADGPGGSPRGRGERVMRPEYGAGVYLHSGEFFLRTREHVLLGRGISFQMDRSYRSQIRYSGPFGHNWDSNINARLILQGSDVLYHDGSGRGELFVHTAPAGFQSPPGLYAVLHAALGGEYVLRWPNGTIETFQGFDGSNRQGALLSVEDRAGNRRTYHYDHQGLLTSIVDSMGRVVALAYDGAGRIVDVIDWAGRTWHYTYGAAGDLVAARSPLVTGTPNGNDFPAGKTTAYTYSFGFADDRLNHNLLTIVAPNEAVTGVPVVQNVYDNAPGFDLDRIVSQTVGGTNDSGIPAGGTVGYAYAVENANGDVNDYALWRRRTTVLDANGNEKEYAHNHPGQCVSETERTNRNVRSGEPDYTTTYSYNADGELLEAIRPLGDRLLIVYDSPGADRYREGNVLEVRRIADALSGGGRGDGHGGEINDIFMAMAYEPVYNQLVALTGPRGNDPSYVPQNGGMQSAARYTTTRMLDYMEGDPALNGIGAMAAEFGIDLTGVTILLGDQNADGRTDQAAGNVVRINEPTVLLDPVSNQAMIQGDTTQEIVTLQRWNDLGQMIGVTDAELNVHQYEYHPETDPDGDGTPTPAPADGRTLDPVTGGYLATRLTDTDSATGRDNGLDPAPAMIEEDFLYDPVGNLTHHVDGRGVLTRWIINQLDQVVEERRAAATATTAGPDGDAATGRGETGLTPFSFKVRYQYDASDNLVDRRIEDRDQDRGAGTEAQECLIWDIKQGKVRDEIETATGVNLITEYRYDPNHNLVQTILPEGNVDTIVYDERDLVYQETRGATGPRGGTPSTRSFDYDANGNLATITDGRGNLVEVLRDGFDREARRIDQVGNTRDLFYDPAANVVRTLLRGPAGGPSPTDRLGASNVDLAEVLLEYDEMHRLFRGRKSRFVPAGIVPLRTPELVEGPLVPGDNAINRVAEFDRLSRTTFTIADTGAQQRSDFDGAGRLIIRTLPGGSTVETFFDANSNVIEEVLTELASSPGLPAEAFITTSFHDALDRLTMSVDNIGQTWRYDYDSLDAVRAASDPNGPSGGAINRRSPAHAATTIGINGHGNVTRFTRDGAGRLLLGERVLTASGLGDGTLNPAPDTTNPHNPDGLIRSTTVWDDNSLVETRFDDGGNRTDFFYDNLNRVVQTTGDDGTLTVHAWDAEDNPVTTTDPNGSVVSRTFDAANRRVQTDVTTAGGVVGTTQQIFEYDGMGRNTSSFDNNDPTDPLDDAEVRTIYDSLDRVVEEQQTLGTSGTKAVDYAWLGDIRLTAITYPSGRRIEYAHDAADRLTGVTDAVRSESAAWQYFGINRIHTTTYGNGIRGTVLNDAGTADIGFDGARRLIELRHLDATSTLLAGFRSTYDAADNRRGTVRPHDFLPTGEVLGELYDLDSGYRLIDFQETYLDATTMTPVGPTVDSQSWIVDGDANWEEMTRDGTDFGFTPSNMHEYDENQSGNTRIDNGTPDDAFDDLGTTVPDGFNHGHDKNGNRLDNGRHLYEFDYLNRLVAIREPASGALVGEYRYDAENRRVRRTIGAGGAGGTITRRYLHTAATGALRKKPGRTKWSNIVLKRGYVPAAPYVPGGAVLEERDDLDLIQREVVFGGGRPLWQILPDGSSQYLHTDERGSIAMLTAGAGSTTTPGDILERVTYDPFGKPVFEDAANQPITDRSGNFAPESAYGNTYLFGALWYDPEAGARGQTPKNDFGAMLKRGAGRYYDPNEGRALTRGLAGSNPYAPSGAPINLGIGSKMPGHRKPREIVVVGSKVKDVVREAGMSSSASSSDKRKQSLYFPESMLKEMQPLPVAGAGQCRRRIPKHSPEWTNLRIGDPGHADSAGRVRVRFPWLRDGAGEDRTKGGIITPDSAKEAAMNNFHSLYRFISISPHLQGAGEVMDLKKVYLPPVELGGSQSAEASGDDICCLHYVKCGDDICCLHYVRCGGGYSAGGSQESQESPIPAAGMNEMRMGIIRNLR